MNSARRRDWNFAALERPTEHVVGARAQQLNPFDARAIRDVVGHAKRQQHVASRADELADFLGRSALTIYQVGARHRVQDCAALRGL